MTGPRESGAIPPHAPDPDTLAAWWPLLEPFAPERLWVGRLPLIRVEIPARVHTSEPFSALESALLNILRHGPASTAELVRSTGLPPGLIGRMLREFELLGLVAGLTDPVGDTRPRMEPRTFTLLDLRPHGPPQFVNLAPGTLDRFPSLAGEAVDFPGLIELLTELPRRDEAWKRRAEFPVEVEALAIPSRPSPVVPLVHAVSAGVVAWRSSDLYQCMIISPNEGQPRFGPFPLLLASPNHLFPEVSLGEWRAICPAIAPNGTGEAGAIELSREAHRLVAVGDPGGNHPQWLVGGDGPLREVVQLCFKVSG